MEVLRHLYSHIVPLIELVPQLKATEDELGEFVKNVLVGANYQMKFNLNLDPTHLSHPPSQSEIVDRVIGTLLRRNITNHVLTFGYKKRTGNTHAGIINHGFIEFESVYPNTVVNFVKNRIWQELLLRIGETAMKEILLHGSIFVPSENGCFFQASGIAVSDRSLTDISTSIPSKSDALCQTFSRKRKRPSDDHVRVNSQIKSQFEIFSGCIQWPVMLYGKPVYSSKGTIVSSLPPNHILKNVSTGNLMNYIFAGKFRERASNCNVKLDFQMKKKWKRNWRLKQGKGIFERLLLNYKQCNLQALLDFYCSVEINPNSGSLLDLQTEKHQVYCFLRAVLSNIIPTDLFGSYENQIQFFKIVKFLVNIRRFDSVSYSIILDGFKHLHHCPPSDHSIRQRLVLDYLCWILIDLVIPLIRSNFYVTETTVHKNELFYFRHRVWRQINFPLYKELVEHTYQKLDMVDFSCNREDHDWLGYTTMRLLPKAIGARPIVNLSKKVASMSSDKLQRGQARISINQMLRNAFHILSYAADCKQVLGSSVSGKDSIYTKLKDFKSSSNSKTDNRYYFCKVDIKSCFDSIRQDQLLKILDEILEDVEYIIHRYSKTHIASKDLKRVYRSVARLVDTFQEFETLSKDISSKLHDSVLVDLVVHPFEEKSSILNLLKSHITNHVIKIGSKFYRQKVGIPQGSVLSTLLCNIFYGHMESNELGNFLHSTDGVLFRYVDDFLFVTTDLLEAQAFCKKVHKPQPKYGFCINHEKTLTNFPAVINGVSLKNVPPSAEFPWCGLLINMDKLDTLQDNSRYLGTHLRNSFSIDHTNSIGEQLLLKVLQVIKNRTHQIHMDSFLNDSKTIRQTIFHTFLVCAMRFCCFTKYAFQFHTNNQIYLLKIIKSAVRYHFSLIQSKTPNPNADGSISKAEVHWLGYKAFSLVLRNRQPKYNSVVRNIEKILECPSLVYIKTTLLHIVERSHSEDVWKIEY